MEMVYEKNELRFASNDPETAALLIAKAGPSSVQQVSRLQMNDRDLIRSNIIRTSIVLGQASVKYSQSLSMTKEAVSMIKRGKSLPNAQRILGDSNLLIGNASDTIIPIGTIVRNLMKNCSYLLCVTAITVLMFVQTANIYWATEYMKGELNGNHEIVDIIFLVCILTAPFVGSILGGVLTTKLGGYTTRGAFILVLGIYLLLLVASLPISFVNDVYLFGSCLWLIVFVFGFTEPILTGIMLNMVSPPERSTAISVTIFLQMIFGLLPAPYVYGLIFEATKDPVSLQSRYAMRFISFTTILGGVALMLSYLLRGVSSRNNIERVKKTLERTQLSKDQIEELVKSVDPANKHSPEENPRLASDASL